jgi:hypothetical protein
MARIERIIAILLPAIVDTVFEGVRVYRVDRMFKEHEVYTAETIQAGQQTQQEKPQCPLCVPLSTSKLIKIMSEKMGQEVEDVFMKLLKGEITSKEAYQKLKEIGMKKGITKEDIKKMIEEAKRT